jgi:hypothetical protein
VKKTLKAKPRTTAMAGAGVLLACLLFVYAWAATKSATSAAAPRRARTPGSGTTGSHTVAAKPNRTESARAAAGQYDIILSRNLFRPSGTVPTKRQAVVPPMPLEALRLPDAGREQEAQQQPQWIYAGYATVDGRPVVIVENAQSKTAEFLRVGDRLEGFLVSDISPSAVQLARGDEKKSLRISEAFTATPLNEPPRPSRAAAGSQGRQRQAASSPGSFFQSDLFQRVIQPALRDNPEYAAQARQFMRNFMRSGQPAAPQPPPPLPPVAQQGEPQ